MVDNATLEFIKSTELPSNSPDLYPPYYHVWNKLKQFVYKSQRESFQLLHKVKEKGKVVPVLS
jgi:hypothetical protein